MFQTEHNLDLFEPFLAFRRALLKVLGCEEHLVMHLFQSASALRKVVSLLSIVALFHCTSYFSLHYDSFFCIQGLRFSLAAAALYELKEHCFHQDGGTMPNTFFLSRVQTLPFSHQTAGSVTSLFELSRVHSHTVVYLFHLEKKSRIVQ